MKDRWIILLLMAIPLAAVLMGAVSMYLAYQGPDQEMLIREPPASKTSWQQHGGPDEH